MPTTIEEALPVFSLLEQQAKLRANLRRALRNQSAAELAHLEETLREALEVVTETKRRQEVPT